MAKKPSKPLAQGTLTVIEQEAPAPDWSRARHMLSGIKLMVRMSIAGQICLGLELLDIKQKLGFAGRGGDHRSKDQIGLLIRTWPELLKAELGIGKTTADRFIAMAEAVKPRLKKLGGGEMLIGLVDTPPSKLTDEKRLILESAVAKATDGATQGELLAELKLVKAPQNLKGGDTSKHKAKHKKPDDTEQLAFIFFRTVADELAGMRHHKDYNVLLHVLPIASDDESALTLNVLERDLEASLRDVRAAKAAKLKSEAAA